MEGSPGDAYLLGACVLLALSWVGLPALVGLVATVARRKVGFSVVGAVATIILCLVIARDDPMPFHLQAFCVLWPIFISVSLLWVWSPGGHNGGQGLTQGLPIGVLTDGRLCLHSGETSTYCTKCWMNLYQARLQLKVERRAAHDAPKEAARV